MFTQTHNCKSLSFKFSMYCYALEAALFLKEYYFILYLRNLHIQDKLGKYPKFPKLVRSRASRTTFLLSKSFSSKFLFVVKVIDFFSFKFYNHFIIKSVFICKKKSKKVNKNLINFSSFSEQDIYLFITLFYFT